MAKKDEAPKRFFRLLKGRHAEGDRIYQGRLVKNGQVVYPGDVIETTHDLNKLNGGGDPAFQKFEEITEAHARAASSQSLANMTVAELRAMAEAEEIQVPSSATKDQIIEILESSSVGV